MPKTSDTRITPLFEIVECCYKPEFESSYVIMLIVACITGSFIAFKNTIHFTCMEYLRVIFYTLRDIRSIDAFGYFGCFEISVTISQVVHFMQLRYSWTSRAFTFVLLWIIGLFFIGVDNIQRDYGLHFVYIYFGAFYGYQKLFIPRLFGSIIPYKQQHQYLFLSQIIELPIAIMLSSMNEDILTNRITTQSYPVMVLFVSIGLGFCGFLYLFYLLRKKLKKPYRQITEKYFNNQFNPAIRTQFYMGFKIYFQQLKLLSVKHYFHMLGLCFMEFSVFGYMPMLIMWHFPLGQNVVLLSFIISWVTVIFTYLINLLLNDLRFLSVTLSFLSLCLVLDIIVSKDIRVYYVYIFFAQLSAGINKFEANRTVPKRLIYPFTLTYCMLKQFVQIFVSALSVLIYILLRNTGYFGVIGMIIGMSAPIVLGILFTGISLFV